MINTFHVAEVSLFKGNPKFKCIIKLDENGYFTIGFSESNKSYNSIGIPFFKILKDINL